MNEKKSSSALADIGREDTHITMESTLARVAQLRRQRSRRRIAGASTAVLAILSLCFWFLYPTTSPAPELSTHAVSPEPSVNSAPSTATIVAPSTATIVAPSTPTVVAPSTAPSRKLDRAATPATTSLALVAASEIRHDAVLKALDFDKAVYEEITTTIGINDDVVMVTNKHDKLTCMQVVCEGGDARTVYCSAPSPSPVMITSPSGRKVMRVEGGVMPSSHLVALRTRLLSDSVLVWYEASPAFLARFRRASRPAEQTTLATTAEQFLTRVDLQRCAPSRMIDGSVRLDVTQCGSHERVVRVDLNDLDGRPIPTEATYTSGGNGKGSIVLSSVPAGVAYVRLVSEDGTSDSFPVALP